MEEIYKNLDLNNLEGEEWRDVVGYEGKYQVSSYGRVKSLIDEYGHYREKIMKQCFNKFGYLRVGIRKDGKQKNCPVHRLVAIAFIPNPNPNNFKCVNHKDECKTNNCVDNLEWCDHKYNNIYGTRLERIDYKAIAAKIDYKAISEKQRNRQDQSKKVYQYTKDYKLVNVWESTKEAGRNGYTQSSISACCRGELKSHRGYIFSYEKL